MAGATRATQVLAKSGKAFTLHTYEYEAGVSNIGQAAADALGEPASRVFKTLMAELDGDPVCVIAPSDSEVSMKKLAAAFGGKSATMMKPEKAEKLTGYVIGGISPLGQRKRVRTVLDDSAFGEDYMYFNGGQRGLQIRMAPLDLVEVLGCMTAVVTA